MSSQITPEKSSIDGLLKLPSAGVASKYSEFAWLIAEEFEEDLRMVFFYDSYDFRLFLLREELLSEDLIPRMEKLHRRAVEDVKLTGSEFADLYGDLQSCALIHEDTAVLCFQEQGGEKGLIATVDYSGGLISVDD